MTETKKVQTEYGTAEIEVVECNSCGNTVGKDDAAAFTIGDREGWACQHCVNEGPISFPKRVQEWRFPRAENGRGGYKSFFFYILFAVIILPIGTIIGFHSDAEQFMKGYATASATYIIYGLMAVGVWWFL